MAECLGLRGRGAPGPAVNGMRWMRLERVGPVHRGWGLEVVGEDWPGELS